MFRFLKDKSLPAKEGPQKDKFSAILKNNNPTLKKISDLLLGEGDTTYKDFFLPLLQRFYNFVLDLPASEEHHHSREGGLFSHSLDVALRALLGFKGFSFKVKTADGVRDAGQTFRQKPSWQYGVLVSALLHDIGKVFDVEVTANSVSWQPAQENLCDFALKHPSFSIAWFPNRGKQHKELGAAIVLKLLVQKDLDLMGRNVFWNVLNSFAQIPDINNFIASIVDKADRESVGVALQEPAPAPIPVTLSRFTGYASEFCKIVRELYGSGVTHWQPNSRQSVLFVGSEYTALVVPNSFREVIKEMEGRGVPSITSFKVLVQELDKAGILKRYKKGYQKNSYKITFRWPEASKQVTLAFVLARNDALWQGMPVPDIFPGVYEIKSGEPFEFIKKG